MHKFGNWGVLRFRYFCPCIALCFKRQNLLSEMKIIKYLLSTDKNRCAVLVYKLVAAVGVDMSHFCAVNVKGRLVLINSQPSRAHGRPSTQDLSERSRTCQGSLTRSRHDKFNVKRLKGQFASHTFQLFFGGSRKRETEGIKPGRWPQQVLPTTTKMPSL